MHQTQLEHHPMLPILLCWPCLCFRFATPYHKSPLQVPHVFCQFHVQRYFWSRHQIWAKTSVSWKRPVVWTPGARELTRWKNNRSEVLAVSPTRGSLASPLPPEAALSQTVGLLQHWGGHSEGNYDFNWQKGDKLAVYLPSHNLLFFFVSCGSNKRKTISISRSHYLNFKSSFFPVPWAS